MFPKNINKNMITMKMDYFFHFGCFAPLVGFLSTIAKQLGYSLTTYGAIMMVNSIVSTLWTPTVGIIVDKFRVKKLLFFAATFLIGIFAIFFLFVPKIPLDAAVELTCHTKTVLTVYTENVFLPKTQSDETNSVTYKSDEFTTCQLICPDHISFNNYANKHINQSDSCDNWSTMNANENSNEHDVIFVTLKLQDTEQINNSYVFRVLSAQVNGTEVSSTTCRCPVKTFCSINCTNRAMMEVATVPTYRGNILILHQFWIFFILVTLAIASLNTKCTIQNSICLDILGNKPEDYGKQKCWASIGWGSFSILVGWLVDRFSVNKTEKDYSPVFYSCVVLVVCDLAVMTKIKVLETKKSVGKWKNVFQLLTKHYVLGFLIWNTFNTLFHTIVTHFLFWYMEDLIAVNNDADQRSWIKTLQGLTLGVQCFGGEIPFFFWSGWIIKRMGHVNCMALTLGVMAVRMYLYTVIANPSWVILIELLNGVSYALGFAVKMSYAGTISPPDTINTVIGFIGFFDCVGDGLGSLLGGYLFDSYGGVWTFRFFACCSVFMCSVNMMCNYFGLMKDVKNDNDTETSMKSVNNKSIVVDR